MPVNRINKSSQKVRANRHQCLMKNSQPGNYSKNRTLVTRNVLLIFMVNHFFKKMHLTKHGSLFYIYKIRNFNFTVTIFASFLDLSTSTPLALEITQTTLLHSVNGVCPTPLAKFCSFWVNHIFTVNHY